MPLLIVLLVLLAVAAVATRGDAPLVRSCPTCHEPLGAGQVDCPVCSRR
jgi:hypothetical protein